ncbi:hypothetical protein LXL04_012813 [Taraxacum kok-saghyz]
MGKNMNIIPSLLLLNKHREIWLWPSCKHPKTLSFRATTDDSGFISPKESLADAELELTTTLGSYFTNSSSESASMSTDPESENYINDNNDQCSSMEMIARGVRSERLFFEPETTSSILETQGSGRQCTPVDIGEGSDHGGVLPYKQSVAMVMESDNPYGDFKKSMEEMVESHELKDWDCLEELLGWYLRTNGKNNHAFIVGAFVDLLAGINCGDINGASCSDDSIVSFTSAVSTFSSPISSPSLYQEKMIQREGKMVTK